MLENRSFDSMLEKLYPPAADFDGLNGTESNPNPPGPPVPVWNAPPDISGPTMRIPDPDPGELWTDINFQIYGAANVPSPSPHQPPPPPMSGLVRERTRTALHPEAVQMQELLTKALDEVLERVAAAKRMVLERCEFGRGDGRSPASRREPANRRISLLAPR